MPLPDVKGREKILQVYSRDKPLSDDVNLAEIARRCLGMSGADLKNVMNESAIFSARKKKDIIESSDILEAIDRIQIGLEKQGGKFSEERQKLVAFHEAGHALLGAVMEDYDLVSRISIVPRGGAGGVTIFTPNEEASESGMYTKAYLENRICVGMGGRIAEELVNGKNKVTTGASNDFQQCTNTAKQMVEAVGMSDVVGPRNIGGAGMPTGPYSRFQSDSSQLGTNLRKKVDDEIDRILKEQYERGTKILTENMQILEAIAKVLIEKEKISGVELLQVIQKLNPELLPADAMKKVEEFDKLGKSKQPSDMTPPQVVAGGL